MYQLFTSFLTGPTTFKPAIITENSKAILYSVKGLNGLDSVDPFCLRILWLLKLSKSNLVKIENLKYAISPSVPLFYADGKKVDHPERIVRRVDTVTNNKIDDNLDTVELSKLKAFKTHCKAFLENAVFLNAWGSEQNLLFSLKYYSANIPSPFKFLFIRKLRGTMTAKLEQLCKDDDVSIIVERAYSNMLAELRELTKYLKKHKYIFRDTPTTLDILLCSYLAPVLLLSYPDSRLKNDVLLIENGIYEKYVKEFVKTYGVPEVEHLKAEEEGESSLLMLFGAGTFAAAAMVLYAIHKGILQT